jgi:Uncharacterized protein conserved in bacteria
MISRNHYKTLIISDVHLGSANSRIKELNEFLRYNTADMLILNGDIIDGWKFKNGSKWKKKYTRFFRMVLRMIEKHNTELVYVSGNHDDFLSNIIPFIYGDIWIVKEHIHYSNGKRYLVVHGDDFDPVSNKLRWLLRLGLAGFPFTLRMYKIYNYLFDSPKHRRKTLSQTLSPTNAKSQVYLSRFENDLIKLARKKNCDGVICGHVHQPAIKPFDDMVYLNSGDWIESMSALAETYKGEWNIVYYEP